MPIYQPQRGTYDAFYEDQENIEKIASLLKQIASIYGYNPISVPVYETTELFARSAGESSDIVTKEMFTFLDKGGRSITLRPEWTAGVMRAIVTNKLYATKDLPLKLSYYGPTFRYERPQAGRYRQFNQMGVENVGVSSPYSDAETITLGYNSLKMIGFSHVILKINSIGDEESRNTYKEALKEYFSSKIDTMCPDCQRRYKINPLRILDCKDKDDQEIIKDAPKMGDFLNENSKKYFQEILTLLDNQGVEYEIDDSLVRGLDYYSHVVFEFHFISKEGTNLGAIGAGGHYDNLVEEVGGPKLSSVGFAFGIERLNTLLKEISPETYSKCFLDVFVVWLGKDIESYAYDTLQNLRLNGFKADMNFEEKSFKSQIKIALRKQAKFILIIGEDEVKNNAFGLKNLLNQEQITVTKDELITKLDELCIEEE